MGASSRRVLVTGGTGVVGKSAVDHLLARGFTVRLLSRNAERDARQWPQGVEPYPASITDDAKVCGAGADCEAILHITGIVTEDPPEVTFEKVNVEGTRALAREAERCASRYHESKRRAEEAVAAECTSVPSLVLRVGNVFGCGDQVLSLLLRMVRSLPVVPVVGFGQQPFQPVWADDLGKALALSVDLEGHDGAVLNLLGPERTTVHEVLDIFGELTGRKPPRVPVPELVARLGTALSDKVGLGLPVHADEVIMLCEGNALEPGQSNAMVDVFGVEMTPLREALRALTEAMPEQLPAEGVGQLERQSYVGRLTSPGVDPEAAMAFFRDHFAELTGEGAMDTEAGRPDAVGATLTMELPMRGQVQVRVEQLTPTSLTLVTLAGHPLAGVIRFLASADGEALRFEVRSYTRAGSYVDLLAMAGGGKIAQKLTWVRVIKALADRLGAPLEGDVEVQTHTLSEGEAAGLEDWLEELVLARKRKEAA